MKTILVLAATPESTIHVRQDQPLHLERELRDIDEGLKRAQMRDQFTLEQKQAVRPRDIRRAILDIKPQIIHFCGHGGGEDGLVFEDERGQPMLVSADAVAGLFELFADRVECVVLSRCYSMVQAEAIAQHIKYVVGTKRTIGDKAAIEFAVGFYDALGAGREYEFAYKLGCSSILMAGIDKPLKPIGLKNSNGVVTPLNSSQPKNRVIEILSSYAREAQRRWLLYIPWPIVRRVQVLLLSSLGVTALVLTLRFFGFLESTEFYFFDQMMIQQEEHPDDRLFLIGITPEDVAKFGGRQGGSVPDKTLAELLKKLIDLNPKVIGLDLYRDFPIEKDSKLENYLDDERIVALCKVVDYESGNQGTIYPVGIDPNKVGFSDVPDPSDVVRRQFLRMKPAKGERKSPNGNPCGYGQEIMDSFSFKLAQKYLKPAEQKKNNLALDGIELERLTDKKAVAWYAHEKDFFNGYQVLLNYRSVRPQYQYQNPNTSPENIAERKSVYEFLEEKNNQNLPNLQGKIVIIGTYRIEGINDDFTTPFRGRLIPGMILQAQMVSQLVSAVKERRPLLRVWSIDYEVLWILAGSWIGLLLAQLCRSRLSLIVSGVLSPVVLYVLCLFLFSYGKLWVPFVPPTLTLLGTEGVVVLIGLKSQRSS